jgi:hypothetical protein
MHAYTGYWSRENWQQAADRRVREERARIAAARKRHRSMPKWQRLLDDLDGVRGLFADLERAISTPRKLESYGRDKANRRTEQLMKRWNRLIRLLNQYNGASQQVPGV